MRRHHAALTPRTHVERGRVLHIELEQPQCHVRHIAQGHAPRCCLRPWIRRTARYGFLGIQATERHGQGGIEPRHIRAVAITGHAPRHIGVGFGQAPMARQFDRPRQNLWRPQLEIVAHTRQEKALQRHNRGLLTMQHLLIHVRDVRMCDPIAPVGRRDQLWIPKHVAGQHHFVHAFLRVIQLGRREETRQCHLM